jgi:hypothetical protein
LKNLLDAGRVREVRVSKLRKPAIGRLDGRPTKAPSGVNVYCAIVNEHNVPKTYDITRTPKEFVGRLCDPDIRRAADQETWQSVGFFDQQVEQAPAKIRGQANRMSLRKQLLYNPNDLGVHWMHCEPISLK